MLVWRRVVSNNCHHHVADVLNRINYRGRSDWSQLSIWWMCLWESTYVSKSAFVWTYLPFLVVMLGFLFIYYTLKSK
jgi:transmembrane protein 222